MWLARALLNVFRDPEAYFSFTSFVDVGSASVSVSASFADVAKTYLEFYVFGGR